MVATVVQAVQSAEQLNSNYCTKDEELKIILRIEMNTSTTTLSIDRQTFYVGKFN